MIKHVKIGRNDPCPCGSGKKYKKCCIVKHNGSSLSKNDHLRALQKSFNWKSCLHPDKDKGLCNGSIIKAHTIPKYVLKKISVNSNVYVPPSIGNVPMFEKLGFRLMLQGIGQATTFTGFCEYHDRVVFSPIENNPIELIPEHIFLIMYRAVCHELFTKSSQVKSAEHLSNNLLDVDVREEESVTQEFLDVHKYSTNIGLRDVNCTKHALDTMLQSKDYSDLDYAYFTFNQTPEIVVSGCSSPFMDFDGNDIVGLNAYNPDVRLGSICCSILPLTNTSVILFSWLRSDTVCRQLIASLLSIIHDELPTRIIHYVFSHFETFAVNPTWWEGLDEEIKAKLVAKLYDSANIFSPVDFECLTDSGVGLVTWKITNTYSTIN